MSDTTQEAAEVQITNEEIERVIQQEQAVLDSIPESGLESKKESASPNYAQWLEQEGYSPLSSIPSPEYKTQGQAAQQSQGQAEQTQAEQTQAEQTQAEQTQAEQQPPKQSSPKQSSRPSRAAVPRASAAVPRAAQQTQGQAQLPSRASVSSKQSSWSR